MSTSVSRQLVSSAALAVFAAALCSAQNIAPAHSGTVHYFEGDVTVDGVKLVSQVARFTEMKEQSELHTGLGRAEILLTPGVLLRVGENSSVKMLDNRLVSTRVEFLSGIAMVEAVDAGSTVKDPPVTIVYKDFQAQPVHFGIFEMTSLPGQVRVFKGEAKVLSNNATVTVKEGNAIDLGTTLATAKFDAKDGDDLYLWSRDRSAYLSAGNMSSARTLANSGYGNSGYGYSNMGMGMGYSGLGSGYAYSGWNPAMWNGFSGGWYYNSYLNMYSFMPFGGTMYSPFGYGYYNPLTIVICVRAWLLLEWRRWSPYGNHNRHSAFNAANQWNHKGCVRHASAATPRDDSRPASDPGIACPGDSARRSYFIAYCP